MQAVKRQWIYAGLAVPQGVALVRRRPRSSSASTDGTMLLLGDQTAAGLAPALGALVAGRGAHLVVRSVPGADAASLWDDGKLPRELDWWRPTVVLFALEQGSDPLAVRRLVTTAHTAGAQSWWAPPRDRRVPGVRAVPPPLRVAGAEGRMSVGIYAAWAGAIWRALR